MKKKPTEVENLSQTVSRVSRPGMTTSSESKQTLTAINTPPTVSFATDNTAPIFSENWIISTK